MPLAPGGLADTLARIIAQRLGEASGQAVVVEKSSRRRRRGGAEAAVRAPADGYTLFMGGLSTNAVLAHLTRLAFDPAKDLAPVIHVATFPNALVVNPGLPAKSVAELVAHAKANPGKLSYASQGNAASGHLVGEQFKQLAGVSRWCTCPIAGGAGGAGSGRGPRAGDVRQRHLAVAADRRGQDPCARGAHPQRLAVLRDVPTMAEAGFGQMQSGTWFGMLAPTGTPPAAIAWVNRETKERSPPRRCASATSRRVARCRSAARRSSPRTSPRSGSAGARSSARPISGWSTTRAAGERPRSKNAA